jgi:hypothetical protein
MEYIFDLRRPMSQSGSARAIPTRNATSWRRDAVAQAIDTAIGAAITTIREKGQARDARTG